MSLGALVALVGAACGNGSGGDGGSGSHTVEPVGECDWPMWGQNIARTFTYPCDTELSVDTVAGLGQEWFLNTLDVVTASPAVVGDDAYVGDWSGRFYAVDLGSGEPRWTVDTDVHEGAFFGQIVSSAAVTDLAEGDQLVLFGGGKTLYALDAQDGEERWRHELDPGGDPFSPIQVETSPVVVDGMVLFGFDSHDVAGVRQGVRALDVETGELIWDWDPDRGAESGGCAGVWSSPAVDAERGLAYVGTANCKQLENWSEFSEALVALDLGTGEVVWSFQPHEPADEDRDFGVAPNLFTVDGRDLVGAGNKDAVYYALDRATGELVWSRDVVPASVPSGDGEFSSRGYTGFIGSSAVGDGVIAGATTGPCPCLHGLDAATGELRWQQELAASSNASAAMANGVLFVGGTDFTFRAVDAATGEVLWSSEMTGAVSGGAAVTGGRVLAVAGIREPGLDERSETSGLTLFSLDADDGATTTTGASAPTGGVQARFAPTSGECIGTPCSVTFGLYEGPPGSRPRVELVVDPDPLRIEVSTSGLGDPQGWIRPGSAAEDVGATVFGLLISESDDNPQGGGVLCTWAPPEMGCSTDTLPVLRDSFNRISLLAMVDAETIPTLSDGADRIVRTQSFDPHLVPEPIE